MKPLPYSISLILAYKEDNKERSKNLLLFKDYYTRLLPNSEIIIEESSDQIFNKCELYNRGFTRATNDVVCFIDSDIFVSGSAIKTAYKHALCTNNVVLGYSGDAIYMTYKFKSSLVNNFNYSDLVKDIQPFNTLRVGMRTDMYRVAHTQSPGGCLLMTKECFRDINGYNPNFKNWGYEDDEILLRSGKLGKNVIRLSKSQDNLLIHLPHVLDSADRSQHKFYSSNYNTIKRVKGMSNIEIKNYIQTWNLGDE